MKNLTQEQQKKMPKIKLITFDLDDTFWDIRSVIFPAEINSRKWIETTLGEKIDWGSLDNFMNIRNYLISTDSSLEYDLGKLRKKIVEHYVHPYFDNKTAQKTFINEAYAHFLKERHKVVFFSGVTKALKELNKHYMLGVLTNGNADVNLLGLGHFFNFSISSMDAKSNKPNPTHFEMAKEISGIGFQNTLHVGDHPINDIRGARDLGINTIWFNFKNNPWELDKNPPIEFNQWSEFINLLSSNYD